MIMCSNISCVLLLPILCIQSWTKEIAGSITDLGNINAETVNHYQLRRQGFVEGTKWRSPGQFLPFPLQAKEPKSSINSIGHGFLRRFRNPTIFLKIACDGDVLLPIVVGMEIL